MNGCLMVGIGISSSRCGHMEQNRADPGIREADEPDLYVSAKAYIRQYHERTGK